MPDFLLAPFTTGPSVDPLQVLVRLVLGLVFGGLVAVVYRSTRPAAAGTRSFSVTLVLLSILIAMVTQVIGDNIARAFSLVGALSIVRFRTVVRDTQDTAYVIFAVVVGMAVGASNPWVAVAGIGVVALAATLMRTKPGPTSTSELYYLLHVRLGLGHDAQSVLGPVFDAHGTERRLVSLATARQGTSIDVTYRVALATDEAASALVKGVNRIDGVQNVELRRVDPENP
ncbi:MAG: DUF4956 domain-containing protein [Vicinamibacterales bacterium]